MSDENSLKFLRNIGIAAHIDAGKTTTTERILYHAGKTHKVGEVHSGDTVTDFDPQERKRGITIFSAAVTVHWNNCQINIIDTPGHIDFTAEVERCLRVLDGAIVVIDGQAGVEAQTETVWRQTTKYQVPRLIFINKMDKIGADFFYSLKTIEEKLNASTLVLQIPIGAESNLQGIIDLIELKAYYFTFGDKEENYRVAEIPATFSEQVKNYRYSLIEKLVEHDDDLANKYLEGQALTISEIKSLIRRATLTGQHFPIFCGTAFKNIGIKRLLDGVVDYLPSPLDKKEIAAFSLADKEKVVMLSPQQPIFIALAFKIITDPFVGKLTFLRVYSGEILSGSRIYNINKGEEEKVSRLMRMYADSREEITKVGTGDIVAVVGLKYTATGDTLGEKSNTLILEEIKFAEPVINLAIEPESSQDQDRLGKALNTISEEDPTFRYWIDQETKQMIIAGMGELHLEVLIERLRGEFKVKVNVGKPQVSYRETITKKVENEEGEYKKQTGGSGHFARVKLTFEPNRDKGFEFVDAKKGQEMSNKDAEEVKEGIEEAMSSGLLLGYPLLDIKATLLEGKRHTVDTKPGDFKNAAILAFRGDKKEERQRKIEKLGLILLEPIMKVEVIIPKDYYGNILASLTSRRGEIEKSEENEQLRTYTLFAQVPLSEMFDYSTSLRSLSGGRGNYSMKFSHYQEVPNYLLDKLLEKKV